MERLVGFTQKLEACFSDSVLKDLHFGPSLTEIFFRG